MAVVVANIVIRILGANLERDSGGKRETDGALTHAVRSGTLSLLLWRNFHKRFFFFFLFFPLCLQSPVSPTPWQLPPWPTGARRCVVEAEPSTTRSARLRPHPRLCPPTPGKRCRGCAAASISLLIHILTRLYFFHQGGVPGWTVWSRGLRKSPSMFYTHKHLTCRHFIHGVSFFL